MPEGLCESQINNIGNIGMSEAAGEVDGTLILSMDHLIF